MAAILAAGSAKKNDAKRFCEEETLRQPMTNVFTDWGECGAFWSVFRLGPPEIRTTLAGSQGS